MPRPRFLRAAVEKRDALLDAAAKEFALRGYDDASINRILINAGFSKGAFYYYFDDKADLAIAVLEREAHRYLDILSNVTTPATPAEFWADMVEVVQLSTARMREGSTEALWRLGTAISRHPELMERLSKSVVHESTAKIFEMWKHGQTIGAVRADLPLSTLMGLIQEMKLALVRAVLPHDRAPTSEEIDTFNRVHLDLVRRVAEQRR